MNNLFKYLVPGDKSAMNPYGIRLGTPALTTRGMKEHDITIVAELIHKGIIYIFYYFICDKLYNVTLF